MKENRKTDCRFIFKREQNFRRRFFAEQNFAQTVCGGSDVVRRAFVGRESPDQLKNDRNISGRGRTDREIFRFHFDTGLSW